MRPSPKNVPTNSAHSAARPFGVALLRTATSFEVISNIVFFPFFAGSSPSRNGIKFRFAQRFRITDWRRDYIPATGPLPKIDRPASFTAKRKFWLGLQNDLAASR